MRGYALRGQLDSDPYCHKLHQQSKTQVLLFLICAGLEIPVPLLGGYLTWPAWTLASQSLL